MFENRNTTLAGGQSVVSNITYKARLHPGTPLAGFNQLFPHGIPVAQPEPSLSLGDDNWECYEAILPDTLNTCNLAIALFQPNTPEALCRVWLEWGIVALPIDWVEVV